MQFGFIHLINGSDCGLTIYFMESVFADYPLSFNTQFLQCTRERYVAVILSQIYGSPSQRIPNSVEMECFGINYKIPKFLSSPTYALGPTDIL